MPLYYKIKITPPLRDTKGRFAKASKALLKSRRDGLRKLGKSYVKYARSFAPGDKFPKTIKYRTYTKGTKGGMELRFYRLEPLGTFISKGTKPHVIRAKNASALSFYWPKVGAHTFVPLKGFPFTGMAYGYFWIGKGYVDHPGTEPNP